MDDTEFNKDMLQDELVAIFKRMYGLKKFEDIVSGAEKETWILKRAVESISTGITIADLDGKILYTNPAEARMHGYEVGELIGKNVNIFVPEDKKTDKQLRDREKISHWIEWQREIINVRRDGSSFPVLLKSIPVKGSGEKPCYIITLCEDITERKRIEDTLRQSLDDKEVLIREINHRTKNSLAVILSLLRIQEKDLSNGDAKSYLRDIQNRIKSMTMIHDRLSRTENFSRLNFSEFIASLANHLFHSYKLDPERVSLNVSIPDIYVDVNLMMPCGLIINELVSNAFKYAFPEDKEGEVFIEIHEREGDEITLIVKDNGIGISSNLDAERNTESLGLQIVSALTNQIFGRLELLHDDGTEFRITFNKKELQHK
jgi:PAS domain S-box-containing protein